MEGLRQPRMSLTRTTFGIVAATVAAGALASCSSSADQPSSADQGPASASAATGETASGMVSPGPTTPASSEDAAGIRAVFARYIETSNAGQAQPYLATICASDPVHQQDLQDQDPAVYPMTLVDMQDITAEGDDGLATVSVKIGPEEQADVITERFTFVREDGAWTVCGKQRG